MRPRLPAPLRPAAWPALLVAAPLLAAAPGGHGVSSRADAGAAPGQDAAAPEASAAPDDEGGVAVAARLESDGGGALAPGSTGTIVVRLELAGGASARGAGVPGAICQLDCPPSVELTEEALTTLEELARNEHLRKPWERLLEDDEARIPFRLAAEPLEGATIGVVVTAFVTGAERPPRFFRRRMELPVAAGAEAVRGDDLDSSWGPDEDQLVIGERAPLFTLPRPDGTPVSLDEHLGAGNLIVTTFRAWW